MILVAGATGTLGGRVVRSLLEQGEGVHILVRDPSPSEQLASMGLATSADSLIGAGALYLSIINSVTRSRKTASLVQQAF